MASERVSLQVGDRDVSLSSPNRVIWPALGITKRELAEYTIAVAEPFLRANGALHERGCSWGLKPPASSSDLAT